MDGAPACGEAARRKGEKRKAFLHKMQTAEGGRADQAQNPWMGFGTYNRSN